MSKRDPVHGQGLIWPHKRHRGACGGGGDIGTSGLAETKPELERYIRVQYAGNTKYTRVWGWARGGPGRQTRIWP